MFKCYYECKSMYYNYNTKIFNKKIFKIKKG